MTREGPSLLRYLLEVYIDDCMSLVISKSRVADQHIMTSIMMGIIDVFPVEIDGDLDPISNKNYCRGRDSLLIRNFIGICIQWQAKNALARGQKMSIPPNSDARMAESSTPVTLGNPIRGV